MPLRSDLNAITPFYPVTVEDANGRFKAETPTTKGF